eukprot:7491421-Lingulodinium_polyedra.AAC.1
MGANTMNACCLNDVNAVRTLVECRLDDACMLPGCNSNTGRRWLARFGGPWVAVGWLSGGNWPTV